MVKLMVYMVMVPFRGIYSVGARIVQLEGRPLPTVPEEKKSKPERKKDKGFKAWIKRPFSKGKLTPIH